MGPTGMVANEKQVGGEHYKSHGSADLQHWDMVVHFRLDYFQGQITKYVMRWRDKGGIADLEKAKHFLEKYIEVESKKRLDSATLAQHGWLDQAFAGGTSGLRGETPRGEKVAGKEVRAARGKK